MGDQWGEAGGYDRAARWLCNNIWLYGMKGGIFIPDYDKNNSNNDIILEKAVYTYNVTLNNDSNNPSYGFSKTI